MDCPYCHVPGGQEVQRSPRTVVCSRCGLYRLAPRMNRSEQISCMEQRVAVGHARHLEPLTKYARGFRWEIALLSRALPSFARGATVLDVGAGSGDFVYAMTQAGAQAVGLEPDLGLVAHAQAYGAPMTSGRFEKGGIPEFLASRQFDLICFRECLYYFPDLADSFDLVRSLLRPGGAIYIKAHQARSYYYGLSGTDYTSRYGVYVEGMPTQDSLSYILSREGFRTIRAGRHPDTNFFCTIGWSHFGESLAGRIANRFVGSVIGATGRSDRIFALATLDA